VIKVGMNMSGAQRKRYLFGKYGDIRQNNQKNAARQTRANMKIARNAIIISKVNSTENERNFTISIYPKLRAKYVF
jgi:hypothetical protein